MLPPESNTRRGIEGITLEEIIEVAIKNNPNEHSGFISPIIKLYNEKILINEDYTFFWKTKSSEMNKEDENKRHCRSFLSKSIVTLFPSVVKNKTRFQEKKNFQKLQNSTSTQRIHHYILMTHELRILDIFSYLK